MANNVKAAEEAAAAKAAEEAAAAKAAEEAAGLVTMTKDGVTLPVHPTCVCAHQAAGWEVAAPDENEED
jgi:hypothetical protein